MTTLEEQLKATLARVADEVPEADSLRDNALRIMRRRRKWNGFGAGAAAVGLTAVVVLGVAVLNPSDTPSHSVVPAASPDAANNWLNLTGKELGDALDLQPIPTDQEHCKYFAEYANNVGYCLDSVPGTDAELKQLARQINGHLPTQGQLVTVPNVVGLWASDASDVIRNAGLAPVTFTFDIDSRVTAQEPTAGTRVVSGSNVTMSLRVGPPHPGSDRCDPGSLTADDPPLDYAVQYVTCFNAGNRPAAQSFFLDVGLPKDGTTITFRPDGGTCKVDREGLGMGTNSYRYMIGIPGRYREQPAHGEAKPAQHKVFILLRGSKHQRWKILEVASACRAAMNS
jgi:hypothetical protein